MAPELMRRLVLEVTYDEMEGPSISTPLPDFFGCPHGRPVALNTALVCVQEGRGFNSWLPMPFFRRVRVVFRNATTKNVPLYYQIDYALGDVGSDAGLLHACFGRQNPTVMKNDYVIVDGLKGPGRFVGCNIGVRVLNDVLMQQHFSWYGEGEVKFYIDDDASLPTICGTGFEDYAGTAWGMREHQTPWCGVQHDVRNPDGSGGPNPEFASLYRWHIHDPIIFRESVRVTVQQIGAVFLGSGQEHLLEQINEQNPVAGDGWRKDLPEHVYAFGICERIDDVCSTAYLYLHSAQCVPRVDVDLASVELERRTYEPIDPYEEILDLAGAFT